jgi:transglutaminase-like putative cysteine protease
MTIEMIACEQEVATSPNAPADLFSNLLLTSPVTIPEAKLKEPITYILKIKPEAKDVQIPSGDMQEVTLEGDKITVRVTPASDDKGEPLDKGNEDKAMSEYLSANGYMQSNDPEIEKLAQKALGDAKDTLTAAHNVESFVHEYITQKNLSAGYSTAKEVMTSREGDCTEHAILTAALCRAAGIPARMACGVVYAEQFAGKGDIFGGHAWTECFVGGKWIGLDATMGENGYGSGHIKLAEGNGRPEDFFSLINMLGNFEIVDIKF